MKIFDTSAWIEYFAGNEDVRGHVDDGEEIVTPDIVLAELARKCTRLGMENTLRSMVYFVVSRSKVEAVDAELALLTTGAWSELSRRAKKRKLGRPSLTDGIILAVARRYSGRNAKVLTTDGHFEGLTEAKMLGRASPQTTEKR